MQRRLPLFGATMLLAAASLSCGQLQWRVIGFVPPNDSSLFWQGAYAGAARAAEEFGMEVLWDAPTETAGAQGQVRILESMIKKRVDGIILAPCDPHAVAAVVRTATEFGIPVSLLQEPVDAGLTVISTDRRQAGQIAIHALGKALEGRARVALLADSPRGQCEVGLEGAFRHKDPNAEIIARRYCDADHASAFQITQELLREKAALDALLCCSEASTVGAIRALRLQAGARQVKIIGFGADLQLRRALSEGVVDALVAPDPFYMGYTSLKAILQNRQGLTPPERIPSPLRLVTAADLGDPTIERLFDPTAYTP